jgi:hypothetical protein
LLYLASSHLPYWERQTEAATDVYFWPQYATKPKELVARFLPVLQV